MSKSKIGRNPNNASSIPGTKYSRPSGSSEMATSDDPKVLVYAIRYGNRATRRLAEQKLASYSHRKLMNQIGADL